MGKEKMLGSIKLKNMKDPQTLIAIKGNDVYSSPTRVRWTLDTDLSNLVEVKKTGNGH